MDSPKTSSALVPVHEVQDSFAGGMRDRDHPSQLDPNQFAYAKNIEIRDAGLAKTRRGRTSKTASLGPAPQGACYFEPTPGNGFVVQVNQGMVFYWNGSGTAWTRIGSTTLTNTTTQVSFSILNGTLYIFAGSNDNVLSWDGVAASLTDEGNTNTDPPRGNLVCQQSGRLVGSGASSTGAISNARDYLFFSDIFGGATWDRASNNKRVPTDGSEPVTALAAYRKEEILTWTRNSTHYWDISGSTVSNFSRTTLDPRVGCIAPLSPQVVGEDAFFMSADRQVRTIKRTIQDIAYGVSLPVSYLVPNLFARINATNASKAAGIYFDNYYLLAVPMDGSTYNSSVIPFDLLHQIQTSGGAAPVCVGEWTNMRANCWVITNFNSRQQLYYIDAVTGAAILMFDTTTDDTVTVPVQIDFRAPNWGSPRHDKTMHTAEFQFLDTIGTVTISYAKDDATFNSLSTATVGDTAAGRLPLNLPFNLSVGGVLKNLVVSFYRRGRSRNWQLRLNHDGGQINLKELTLSAWVEGVKTR